MILYLSNYNILLDENEAQAAERRKIRNRFRLGRLVGNSYQTLRACLSTRDRS